MVIRMDRLNATECELETESALTASMETASTENDHHSVVERHRPRVAFYSHDTMGMGHLRRNMLIASSMASGPLKAETLLIAGTREAGFFAEQAGLDCITLPAVSKSTSGEYRAKYYDWSLKETAKLRGRVIASTLLAFSPDIFVVDKLPQGICDELLRVLRILRRRNSTRCVLGLRDILDTPEVAMAEWKKANNDQIIADYFDEVWVYGDPKVFDCRQEYRFCETTQNRMRFVGYLDQSDRLSNAPNSRINPTEFPSSPFVLCVVGGGQDGFQLASTFCRSKLPDKVSGVVITGPFMPLEERLALQRLAQNNPHSKITIVDHLVECDQYLSRAERVIAMGGYNSVTSILSFSKPSLIVPRVRPRQEQLIRAVRLADANWLSYCHPDDLNVEFLSRWLCEESVPDPRNCTANISGLQEIDSVVETWCKQRVK